MYSGTDVMDADDGSARDQLLLDMEFCIERWRVSMTDRGEWVLERDGETQVFECREELARFLWAEAFYRKDSLILMYGLGMLRPTLGELVLPVSRSSRPV